MTLNAAFKKKVQKSTNRGCIKHITIFIPGRAVHLKIIHLIHLLIVNYSLNYLLLFLIIYKF